MLCNYPEVEHRRPIRIDDKVTFHIYDPGERRRGDKFSVGWRPSAWDKFWSVETPESKKRPLKDI